MVVALMEYFDSLTTFWVLQLHHSPAQIHFCWNYQHQNKNFLSWPSCPYSFCFYHGCMIYRPCPLSYLPPNYNSWLFLVIKAFKPTVTIRTLAAKLTFYKTDQNKLTVLKKSNQLSNIKTYLKP